MVRLVCVVACMCAAVCCVSSPASQPLACPVTHTTTQPVKKKKGSAAKPKRDGGTGGTDAVVPTPVAVNPPPVPPPPPQPTPRFNVFTNVQPIRPGTLLPLARLPLCLADGPEYARRAPLFRHFVTVNGASLHVNGVLGCGRAGIVYSVGTSFDRDARDGSTPWALRQLPSTVMPQWRASLPRRHHDPDVAPVVVEAAQQVEARLMMALPEHRNVLHLRHAVYTPGAVVLVTRAAELGSLADCFARWRPVAPWQPP